MLRSAFFDDFNGGPKLLFWGNAKGMNALAEQLMKCAASSKKICLDTIGTSVDGKTIIIEPVASSAGMRQSGGSFIWRLDSEWMAVFAEMVGVLAVSKTPGHQYLECGVDGEIEVMVSKDEYRDDLNPQIPGNYLLI